MQNNKGENHATYLSKFNLKCFPLFSHYSNNFRDMTTVGIGVSW